MWEGARKWDGNPNKPACGDGCSASKRETLQDSRLFDFQLCKTLKEHSEHTQQEHPWCETVQTQDSSKEARLLKGFSGIKDADPGISTFSGNP